MDAPATTRRAAPPLVRSRLLRRLAGAWKVASLSAPAGYGKSTLAAQYAARRQALWCRLDRDDRDLNHLFGRFVAAGLQARPPLTRRTERLFLARRDMDRDGGWLTASLLRELTPDRGFRVVVLEDLHVLAGAREALAWLRALLEESGPAVRFLLTSRGLCPLPLARYELQGGVVQLGPEDLELDEQEQDRFLRRALGARYRPEEHADLRASLQGWPAGFALLARAAPGVRPPPARPPRAAHGAAGGAAEEDRTAGLFRYLAEEVFAPLDPAVQKALCRVSLLDDLEPLAVDLLVGPETGAVLRRELDRRALLIRRLPDRGGVPAFHPLFLEFLKERRAELLPVAEARRLGRRLARRLLRRGEAARAIRVYLETQDAPRAVAAFDRAARREGVHASRSPLVPAALDILRQAGAEEAARSSPWVLSVAAIGLYKEGRYADAAGRVAEAQELWLRRRAYLEVARLARLAAACAWITGHSESLVQRLESFLARVPAREGLSRAILMAEIGGLRLLAGQPRGARRYLSRAEGVLRGTPHELQVMEIRLSRANVLYSEGRWAQYLAIAHRALALFRRAGLPGRCQSLLINMAEAHTYLGEEDRALSLLDEAEGLQPLVLRSNAALIALGRARALVERGDASAGFAALDRAREAARRHGSRLWELQADFWSGVLERRQGRLDAAHARLVPAVEGFREIGAPAWRNVAEMELGLVRGLLRQAGALRALEEAALVSRRLGDAKELAKNLLFQARVRQLAAEEFESVLRRALRLLERERYLVLLRKESDVAQPLLRAATRLPAELRSLAPAAAFLPSDRAPEIEVRLLGGLEVTIDGRSVSFPRRASGELVARLSLRPGEPILREDLAETLWPGASAESSRNRFDVALNGARRLLEPEASPRGPFRVLESAGGWCRLVAAAVRVDVQAFEAAARRCETHLRELAELRRTRRDSFGDAAGPGGHVGLRRAAADLSGAAQLYRGDLLPELIRVEWTQPERERLRSRFRRILLGHASICLRLGEAEAAEADARRLLESDPLDEEAQQTLLAALARRGDHLAAIRSYRSFAKRIRRELGVPPGPETTARFHASMEAARRSSGRAAPSRNPPRRPAR